MAELCHVRFEEQLGKLVVTGDNVISIVVSVGKPIMLWAHQGIIWCVDVEISDKVVVEILKSALNNRS